VLIAGVVAAVATDDRVAERVHALQDAGMSARDASASAAAELGVSKRLAYRLARHVREQEDADAEEGDE
jgi:hypothetical protein